MPKDSRKLSVGSWIHPCLHKKIDVRPHERVPFEFDPSLPIVTTQIGSLVAAWDGKTLYVGAYFNGEISKGTLFSFPCVDFND